MGRKEWREFAEAREWARRLSIRTSTEWRAWVRGKRPDLPPPPVEAPLEPSSSYRNKGWKSWGDFTGTGSVWCRYRTFRPFEDARAFVRALGLRSSTEWGIWSRGDRSDLPTRPMDIPSNPAAEYADSGFTTWGDFLGTGRPGRGSARR